MENQCVKKAKFIGNAFIDAGAIALDIPDEHQRQRVLYHHPGSSFFVLATVGFDFRDVGWQIDLSQTRLESLVEPAANYCFRFLSGDAREALLARLHRNASRASDPLWLESKNSDNKDVLEARNEELKKLYAKYL